MKLVQPLLILAALLVFATYMTRFRNSLRDRAVGIILFATASAAIIFPDFTHVVAHTVGVGRGVDLFFYLFALMTMYCIVILYSKIGRLENVQTQLVRRLAILQAESPCVRSAPDIGAES